jgi:hypothetical protein
MRSFFILSIFLINFFSAAGQYNVRDSSIAFPTIGVSFTYQAPGGDMADRFGNNFAFGAVFQYKLKSNWMIGIEGRYLFSDRVRENNILDRYKTPDGFIIDGNGQYGSVLLYERGLQVMVKGGKIFPLRFLNPNSGLWINCGAGYLQHKIWIDTPGSPIPFLEGDNRKGFDRFTNGIAVSEFIGLISFSDRKLVNFYAGFEFTQGFTQNRRSMNFDTGLKDETQRLDLLFGIHVGWMFPIYKRVADKYYTR